ncbi:FAD:protein FMN transferase [Slackia heliotrinireducens]|uniref:FAD:protein FMN transferase n=1 Tax=Slackia heliotrinireducens TaxID=84110 RepID=UPI003315F6D4
MTNTDSAIAAPVLHNRFFHAFDTRCRIYAATDDVSLFDEITSLCARYDRLFSHTRSDSELVRLNRACGMPVAVHPELAGLIAQSLDYCAESDGLFDVTAGSLERLWNFHTATLPTSEQVNEALRHVGFGMVHVNGNVACIDDPLASVVLGGVAKGYIADRIADLMRKRGVTSGVIDLGGNIVLVGSRPDGKPWRIEIVDPFDTTRAIALLDTRDESVVTSGTYERFFEIDDERYHHIIDPRTGRPAKTDLVSATVVTPKSVDGDGYTTGLIIMGSARAFDFVEHKPNLEAIFVLTDGSLRVTSGLQARVYPR